MSENNCLSLQPKSSIGMSRCPCCGGREQNFRPVIWPELSKGWGLSTEEIAYVDRQQGSQCVDCGANLRTQALALAILRVLGAKGTFRRFARSIRGRFLRILEINAAGNLSQFFPVLSGHEVRNYPELDMMAMNLPSRCYDLVIHSDTLEHVPNPVQGLSECMRVLKPGGACCFTVPIIVGRLTKSREGLPPTYHGREGDNLDDYLVHTEYGADTWRHALMAGFAECRIVSMEHPAAHALVGIRGGP